MQLPCNVVFFNYLSGRNYQFSQFSKLSLVASLEIVAMGKKERNLPIPADVLCVTKAAIFILVLW